MLKGGDKLKERLSAIAEKMAAGSVKVGFMSGATYPNGTPVAAVAFWNEYGAPSRGQPPRPFFRQMIAKESPTWAPKLAALCKSKDYDGDKVLALMGEDIGGALQQSVNDFTTPALADSTKARKGFDKPLINSADMIRSISYHVDGGEIVPIPYEG